MLCYIALYLVTKNRHAENGHNYLIRMISDIDDKDINNVRMHQTSLIESPSYACMLTLAHH